jgi:hypothetical protein
MSISFMPYVEDPARNIWRSLAGRTDPGEFELNVSDANGADLLLVLGLPPEPVGGPWPIDAFAGMVTAALRRHLDRRSPKREPVTETGGGRATFIFCGRREGYIEDRLGDLARLIQRSRAAGATHFMWG